MNFSLIPFRIQYRAWSMTQIFEGQYEYLEDALIDFQRKGNDLNSVISAAKNRTGEWELFRDDTLRDLVTDILRGRVCPIC